jgi:hypothetical protein
MLELDFQLTITSKEFEPTPAAMNILNHNFSVLHTRDEDYDEEDDLTSLQQESKTKLIFFIQIYRALSKKIGVGHAARHSFHVSI